jgi:hypothetical protein
MQEVDVYPKSPERLTPLIGAERAERLRFAVPPSGISTPPRAVGPYTLCIGSTIRAIRITRDMQNRPGLERPGMESYKFVYG